MKFRIACFCFLVLAVVSLVCPAAETRLMHQPALSQNHIAFIYANDLWIADREGKNPRRLTIDEGVESNPAFSPDGKLLAFSAQYEGNADVYLLPVEGGVPKRLTYHPGEDRVLSFTPDGRHILFASGRNVFSNRYTQFFTVSIDGGMPEQLKIPNAYAGGYSPDGQQMAYNPLYPAFLQWKNYRGGTVSTIWILRLSDSFVEKVKQPEGRCNDYLPQWLNQKIYFLSDRNGEFNLFHFDPKSKEVRQLTQHRDFPVLNFSGTADTILYEQAGYLHLLDIRSGKSKKLGIAISADLPFVRPRYVKGSRYIQNVSISPTGARALFNMRGDVVTVPAEKGDPRNLTQTPGVHERSAKWAPDGQQIAYFSDESGEYELYIRQQDGKQDTRKWKLGGSGFYEAIAWSPDSRKICFRDNSLTLYWIELQSGTIKKIASDVLYAPSGLNSIRGSWSPDSKWIAYTLVTKSFMQSVYVYSLEKGQSFAITDGMSEVSEPIFDRSGKYLYFLASTDAGPVKQWFDMSNADMRATNAMYLVTLRQDIPSPLAKESDEERKAEKKEGTGKTSEPKDAGEGGDAAEKEAAFAIDLEGIGNRIVPIPLPAGSYSVLQTGKEGEIYYLERNGSDRKLCRYDLKKKKSETIVEKLDGYELSFDRNKIFYSIAGSFFITTADAKVEAGKGRLDLDAVELPADPRQEWPQIYREAWRTNRDYFYDPNFHGADWPAMKEKYAVFLDHLTCRQDLNRVIQWMCSELVVGHHRVYGGDTFVEKKSVPVGLLGADYAVENGRYRFRKIYTGLNWNPDLRSPLGEPGSEVKTGEYLLAVGGKDLVPPMNLYGLFENTSGKLVEIRVGPHADGSNSRILTVVPIPNEYALRNRDWVEGNMKKVHDATGGRVAYVYVPNTSTLGHAYFKRYFFPQADKEAIIVDERFNGGGSIADYYIDILKRRYIAHWAMRYGIDFRTPGAMIEGPKVLIADETAGSGGDLFPWMWRKFHLGPIVGKRTWGGLVGILGFPPFLDNGGITAPNLAIWTEEGWVVENEGVPVDIEVDQLPAEVNQGKDPQLDKAIQVILDELKKNPPKKPTRPPYPVRVRKS